MINTVFHEDSIPDELKSLHQWLIWKPEPRKDQIKPTKVPYCAHQPDTHAKSNDPKTWASFSKAVNAANESQGCYGIGLVLTESDPYVGVDLDNCRDPDTGETEDWATEAVSALASYTEVSPSGTGLRIICKGHKPGKSSKHGNMEMYDRLRYLTMTGNHVSGTPITVCENNQGIAEVYQKFLDRKKSQPISNFQQYSQDPEEDSILIDRAMNANDGAKFATLWYGDWERLGYVSESEADLALTSKLNFWTGGDRHRIDRLFRQSGLYREKWERSDYRNWTLDKALDGREYYTPARPINLNTESQMFNSQNRAWPEPMDEAAYHGITGEIIRAIEPHTEADPAALLFTFLTFAGNAMGRGPHAIVEADRHGPNIMTVLAGPTSKARKGSSEGHIRALFKQVDPEWADNCILGGLSSGEGLLFAVRNPIEKAEPIREQGKPTGEYQTVIVDQGVDDKRLLASEPEFASVLKVMGRVSNILSVLIRQAWDCGDLRTMTKNNPMSATGAHISILGHITKDELMRHLNDTETANGFANRFLWACVRRAQVLPEGGGQPEYRAIIPRLREALDRARDIGQVKWNEEARLAWREIYEELSDGKPGLLGSVTARGEAQVLRLSVIYAALDGAHEIGLPHLEAALAVWEYAERSAVYIFGDATGDPVADRIIEGLRLHGEMNRTQISTLFQRNTKSARISQALDSLLGGGRVRLEKRDTDGRPTEIWTAA